MKQHITVGQLNQSHILDALNLAVILEISPNDYRNDEELDKMVSEKMTIGEMIEIIGHNNCLTLEQENVIPNDSNYGLKWVVRIFHDIDCPVKEYEAEELCDALWEAVKRVL